MKIANSLLSILAVSLIFISGCSKEETSRDHSQFQNPVFEPVLADPSMIKGKDGNYYAYGTEDDWGDGKGAKYIPIIKSSNLTDWKFVGDAFTEKGRPTWKQGGLWAPDIQRYNGKYYLYYSLSTWGDYDPGIGVATSDSPGGPFQDQGQVLRSSEIGVENSIDPFFIEDNGIPYLFWGSFHGIYGVELSEDGTKTEGEIFQIAGNAYEAPYMIKRDGYYYFFGSLGSCCEGRNSTYRVAAARSKSIKGPYVDKKGVDILVSEGTPVITGGETYIGPGHNAIVTDDKKKDWIIYHAIDKKQPKLDNGATRRPLFIDPIVWKDGWPRVKNGVPGEEEQSPPFLNKK
ncbi:family 43 glycosylhydrolase [Fictibacillus phosphorivorans]|uniref:family 43 glycosylhydrolase n=1 Tax=Fictibacillus phosphorivorans TaxID=1221500 RepID=UPI00203CF61D|nr:family 43 glycosylhydrolase [Fictibacillus phosphorivorans]MCM3717742.1 family 43 glycosylhydrolase [Fictibacillus phosphorivorans]MCM3775642.1 family 43 glycosylhydrolase [Fictibacillus phosphorivorans]